MAIVTIGEIVGRQPFTAEAFVRLYTTRIAQILPRAVEETAEYIDVVLNNGNGVYTILTDASLIGATLSPDEYLYLAMFFANYSNGYVTYATLLTDDPDSESFMIMLDAVTSIEVSDDPASKSSLIMLNAVPGIKVSFE